MDQEKWQQPNEESEPSKEEFMDTTPVVVFNGECRHKWYFTTIDSDGHGRARCKKCPMGKIFDPKKVEVKNGKIVSK